jgi:hypothetical protein
LFAEPHLSEPLMSTAVLEATKESVDADITAALTAIERSVCISLRRHIITSTSIAGINISRSAMSLFPGHTTSTTVSLPQIWPSRSDTLFQFLYNHPSLHQACASEPPNSAAAPASCRTTGDQLDVVMTTLDHPPSSRATPHWWAVGVAGGDDWGFFG